jgi:hypothetical protein
VPRYFAGLFRNRPTSRGAGFEVEIYCTLLNGKNRKSRAKSTAFPHSESQLIPQVRDCSLESAGDITLDRMDAIRLRQVQQREYRDPTAFLKGLRRVELEVLANVSDPRVRRLRTNSLREWRETRIAALFCHGMSELTGVKVFLSKGEFEDADFVATWTADDTRHFALVQLKEVAPDERGRGVDDVLESLAKYSGKEDLTVLIHLNREVTFNPAQVVVPPNLQIAALWFLFCSTPDHSEWTIWGNFLETPERTRFAYPV